MLDFFMQKFCWQFSSLTVVGISSISLLKFMSTWDNIVCYRFQRCIQSYCPIWLSKQLCEVSEAHTFIYFLCTWNLRSKQVETHLVHKQILTIHSVYLYLSIQFDKSFLWVIFIVIVLENTDIQFKTEYNKLISLVYYYSLHLISQVHRGVRNYYLKT